MNKEEMICKNCKYHYIEEISFDYPQSCCDKRKTVIEEWFNCNDFEYSDSYIKQLQKENNKQKEVIDKVRNNLEKDISVIKNIKMSNKEIICRLEETNKLLKEVSE